MAHETSLQAAIRLIEQRKTHCRTFEHVTARGARMEELTAVIQLLEELNQEQQQDEATR